MSAPKMDLSEFFRDWCKFMLKDEFETWKKSTLNIVDYIATPDNILWERFFNHKTNEGNEMNNETFDNNSIPEDVAAKLEGLSDPRESVGYPITAETSADKSRLIHMDEPAFIPDVTKVQNHTQSGRFGKEIYPDDNPAEFYPHEITAADLSTKHIELDSMSQHSDEKSAIEHPVVNITVNQEESSVTAAYGGKTLIERNPGDWFVQGAFQVIQKNLCAAWKTKFKESLPTDFQTSFSFNGGFSMGGKRNLFTAPPTRPKRVSKHASGQSKKKKRK